MPAYYNEFDPFAAQWLRNLIAAGHIAPGDVDERSIVEVQPDDLRGYTQCHFFAGIGTWSLALRIAGWPDERPVWTGSPPCQDVSLAGAVWGVRSGLEGARTSLARCWLDLVGAVRPGRLLFENVPGIAQWLAEIEGRMASLGYAVSRRECSTADVAGPCLRRRVWIAADRDGARWKESGPPGPPALVSDPRGTPPGNVWVASARRAGGLDDGFPARMAAVRAFGNAIDPQVASTFVRAVMECMP